MIEILSPAQIMKIAAGNMLLCRFRVDDELIWGLLTSHKTNRTGSEATSRLHASILMSGQHAESL
jgi:flagellar transcriptional activator FlhD